MQYKINSPNVVSDNFNDESVVVNLDSGTYFSFQGTAFVCWNEIISGKPISDIREACAGYFTEVPQVFSADLQIFVSELLENQLIVEGVADDVDPFSFDAGKKIAYQAPLVQKFTDMQEILLLDPVHDVDQAGWPKAKDISKDS